MVMVFRIVNLALTVCNQVPKRSFGVALLAVGHVLPVVIPVATRPEHEHMDDNLEGLEGQEKPAQFAGIVFFAFDAQNPPLGYSGSVSWSVFSTKAAYSSAKARICFSSTTCKRHVSQR